MGRYRSAHDNHCISLFDQDKIARRKAPDRRLERPRRKATRRIIVVKVGRAGGTSDRRSKRAENAPTLYRDVAALLLAQSMNKDPWPEKYVEHRAPSAVNSADYERILRTASDERPLQDYISNVPSFLRMLMPATVDFWCFDRPSLGGELVPDFLLCLRNSRGFNWGYVELESPTKPPLLKSGRPSAKLTEALAQISDWRDWLRENIAYARSHLGLRQIDAEALGFVVIGRRHHVDPKHALKYRALSSPNTTVLSYDRLLEVARARAF